MSPDTASAKPGVISTILPDRLVAPRSYRIELSQDLLDEQGKVLDSVISFAFDTLGVYHLDLRIVAGARSPR